MYMYKCINRYYYVIVYFSDITKIQTGIGDKIGSLVQAVSMLLGGFIIGFIYSWKLTLVIIACTPLILIAAFATGKVKEYFKILSGRGGIKFFEIFWKNQGQVLKF